ncbi:MAG TPA: hypothetical protein VM925_27520 [Labilithrix sp.]|nr:hypothetical protein [Labilithrix sp.]
MFFRPLFLVTLTSTLALASLACSSSTTGTGPALGETADGGKAATHDDDDNVDPKPTTGTKIDAGTKPSPQTGTSTCREIFSCAAECAEPGCEDVCYNAGSTKTQQQVDAVVKCSADNACEDGACIEQNCAAELTACE